MAENGFNEAQKDEPMIESKQIQKGNEIGVRQKSPQLKSAEPIRIPIPVDSKPMNSTAISPTKLNQRLRGTSILSASKSQFEARKSIKLFAPDMPPPAIVKQYRIEPKEVQRNEEFPVQKERGKILLIKVEQTQAFMLACFQDASIVLYDVPKKQQVKEIRLQNVSTFVDQKFFMDNSCTFFGILGPTKQSIDFHLFDWSYFIKEYKAPAVVGRMQKNNERRQSVRRAQISHRASIISSIDKLEKRNSADSCGLNGSVDSQSKSPRKRKMLGEHV